MSFRLTAARLVILGGNPARLMSGAMHWDKLLTAFLVISVLVGCTATAIEQGQPPYSPSLPEDRQDVHNGGDGGGGSM
jgi:hypothetical protein